MSECKLKNGSISTLVQEDLRQDGSESWVKNWPDECSLEVGTIIRIPYDEEVIDRLDTPTLTGRLCRPFTDLFCVQWPEQQELYPGALDIGRLM